MLASWSMWKGFFIGRAGFSKGFRQDGLKLMLKEIADLWA